MSEITPDSSGTPRQRHDREDHGSMADEDINEELGDAGVLPLPDDGDEAPLATEGQAPGDVEHDDADLD